MTGNDAYVATTLLAAVGLAVVAFGWAWENHARVPGLVAEHRRRVADARLCARFKWARWALLRANRPATVNRPADPSPRARRG